MSIAPTTFTASAIDLKQQNVPDPVKRAGDEFEAVFLSQMMAHMFAEIPVNETFGGGAGEKMFRSMLVNEYGSLMVKAGGIGVSEAIQREMIELQERAR